MDMLSFAMGIIGLQMEWALPRDGFLGGLVARMESRLLVRNRMQIVTVDL